jgi:hypothetical protein
MTPQERQLVAELFDRLASLETTPRDAEAERAMADGLARAPHAIYPLVQTVLLQDEALRRADTKIRELEGSGHAPQSGGFLDTMRSALFPSRGVGTSVPSVSPSSSGDSRWGPGAQAAAPATPAAPMATAPQGSSFLGTAAASAAGVIGGALLYNSISSMFGHQGHAFAGQTPAERSPWGGGDASGSGLARDAGLGDIPGSRGHDEARSASLFGDTDNDTVDSGGDDFGGDPGGDA